VYGSNGVQIAPDFLEQIGVQAMVSRSSWHSNGTPAVTSNAPQLNQSRYSHDLHSHLWQATMALHAAPSACTHQSQSDLFPAFLAQTLGNHEFDDGPESLATFIGNASFPVLSCNLDTSAEPLLDGLVQVCCRSCCC
jgi:hypothetical protein